MKKGTRVMFVDEHNVKREGKVIGPDKTHPDNTKYLAIRAKEPPNYGFYSRAQSELEEIK